MSSVRLLRNSLHLDPVDRKGLSKIHITLDYALEVQQLDAALQEGRTRNHNSNYVSVRACGILRNAGDRNMCCFSFSRGKAHHTGASNPSRRHFGFHYTVWLEYFDAC
jgi:hypothetical protein